MKKFCVSIAILVWAFPGFVQAQEVSPFEPTVEQRAHKEFKKEKARDKFISLAVENDSIGRGTDQHYTSGVQLRYYDLGAEFSPLAHKIASVVPTFRLNETSSVFYSLGHNIYTPDDITRVAQDPRDRPWAGFLYGSMGMATLTDDHVDELEVTLGVVGPAAMGEQAQKFFHTHVTTDSPTPRGWSNQLKNEPGIILSWQRGWPQYLRTQLGPLTLTSAPYIGTSLGNIYTYANTGIRFRLADYDSPWDEVPLRVRPAVSGSGYFDTLDGGWSWYVFGGLEGRAMARNIFLDGNTFTDSHAIDKKVFVGDANLGVAFTFGNTQLSYTLAYRSREFERQDRADLFGAVSVSYRF